MLSLSANRFGKRVPLGACPIIQVVGVAISIATVYFHQDVCCKFEVCQIHKIIVNMHTIIEYAIPNCWSLTCTTTTKLSVIPEAKLRGIG